MTKEIIYDAVINSLQKVYDPEIMVNIYDLGLIYKVDVNDNLDVNVLMTMTAPNCPMAEELFDNVKTAVESCNGVNKVDVTITFDPPWDKSMMSENALLDLGML